MVNHSSIKYISSLLNNPETITSGDQSSIALFRQTFPYFVPVRYLAAVESNKHAAYSPAMLSEMQPYLGDWILFCDFLEAGARARKPDANADGGVNRVLDKKKVDVSQQQRPEPEVVKPNILITSTIVPPAPEKETIAKEEIKTAEKPKAAIPQEETNGHKPAAPALKAEDIPVIKIEDTPQIPGFAELIAEQKTEEQPAAKEPIAAPVAAVTDEQTTLPEEQTEARVVSLTPEQFAAAQAKEAGPAVEEVPAATDQPQAVVTDTPAEATTIPIEQEEEPAIVVATVVEQPAEILEPVAVIPEPVDIPEPMAVVTEEEIEEPVIVAAAVTEQPAEILQHVEVTEEPIAAQAEAPVAYIEIDEPTPVVEVVEEVALPVEQLQPVTDSVLTDDDVEEIVAELEVMPLVEATDTVENKDELISPVYTQDYFLQQGEKVSEEIPDEIDELIEKEVVSEDDEDKSLMVMMSFSEWLLHFKNTSQKQQEEKKDQKALKTMWQKEKLAAAMEEENEEIPESVFQMAVDSITKEEDLASEPLANIYIKQGRYDQAIEMYRKLSLRNPQKSAYFARKIEEILKEKS